jgi:hypothetical protein
MAGLRSEEEILKAFEGLDKPPGSKQPRKALAAPAKKTAVPKSLEDWDSNPIKKSFRGKDIELFTVGALSQALGKQIVTVRLWERKGYLPSAPFRLRAKQLNGAKVNGNRAYTRELIEIAIEEFDRRGLLGSARVEWSKHPDLPKVIATRWKQVLNPATPTN